MAGETAASLATSPCGSPLAPRRRSPCHRDRSTASGPCQHRVCRPPRLRAPWPVLPEPTAPGRRSPTPLTGANRDRLAPRRPVAHRPRFAVRPLDPRQIARRPDPKEGRQVDQPGAPPTRLSDPYATAAILFSRVSTTSGEGTSVPDGPKTSYCHICNRNAPNMSVNVGLTL